MKLSAIDDGTCEQWAVNCTLKIMSKPSITRMGSNRSPSNKKEAGAEHNNNDGKSHVQTQKSNMPDYKARKFKILQSE